MSDHESTQPAAKKPMSFGGEIQALSKKAGTEYVKESAKEGGKQTVDGVTGNEAPEPEPEVDGNTAAQPEYDQKELDVNQNIDDAKAQAQGMWAKYCGCFSSS